MKFGMIFPNRGPHCDRELALRAASVAEESGFDAFLVWDHYLLPRSSETFEAWILLSHLAAKTSTIRLGTCVTPIPLRPPAILAKVVSTVDHLSNGRVILGVGAGWHRPEFEGYSEWSEPSERVAKVREGLELMVGLWTKGRVNYRGRYYSAKGAILEPKPIQKPYPPLWFGTVGDYMLKLAAKYGSGWIPVGISPGEYVRGVGRIRRYSEGMGTAKGMTYALDADPKDEPRAFISSIEEYRSSGCEHYDIVWDYPRGEFMERIGWFAREVMPSFQ